MIFECSVTLFDVCVAPLCLSGPNIRRLPHDCEGSFYCADTFAAFAFLWLLPCLLNDLHTEGWKGQKYQLNFRLLCLQVIPPRWSCCRHVSHAHTHFSAWRSAFWTCSSCPSRCSRSLGEAFSPATFACNRGFSFSFDLCSLCQLLHFL